MALCFEGSMPWPVPVGWEWSIVRCPWKAAASFSKALLAEELARFRDIRGLTAISLDALISALVILIMRNDAHG